VCAALFASCAAIQKQMPMVKSLEKERDTLSEQLAYCTKANASIEVRNETLENELTSLRSDTAAKQAQNNMLSLQNAEYKRLNDNLTAQQTKLAAQAAAESKAMLEDLQRIRESLFARQDSLDILQANYAEKTKMLNDMMREMGFKNDEISLKNRKIADMEQMINRKDSLNTALRKKIQKALTSFEGKGLTIEQRGGKVYVVLEESLLFKVGQSAVGENGQNALKQLAAVLEQNPDIDITIEGHTDNTGGSKRNWELSTERALAISQILLNNSKIDGKRITVSGKGQYSPIATNNTAEGRAKNRRSEIILTPDLQEIFEIIQN
jgi:chemotaxis protein MotB